MKIANGWLEVPYNGPDLSTVELGYTEDLRREPLVWQPAFLDYAGATRVAKISLNKSMVRGISVWMRVNGIARRVGSVR